MKTSSPSSAKMFVLGVAVLTTCVCWILSVISNNTSYMPRGYVNGVPILAAVLSLTILLRRLYYLAFLPAIFCALIFLFPFSFHGDGSTYGAWQWREPLIESQPVTDYTRLFLEYTEEKWGDPIIEKRILTLLYFFTPTFLIGCWGLVTLCRADVREMFRRPRRPAPPGDDFCDKSGYWLVASRHYGILLLILWIGMLPVSSLAIYNASFVRETLPMLETNSHLLVLFLFLFFVSSVSFMANRLYWFALLGPFLWLATLLFMERYDGIRPTQFQLLGPDMAMCAEIAVFYVPKVVFFLLGAWICWKNRSLLVLGPRESVRRGGPL